jgi:uracil-DNA glycosylase family 4
MSLTDFGAPNFSYHPECTRCPLHKQVTSVGIGGNGPVNPDIMVVGATPFRQEDAGNLAFWPKAPAGANLRNLCNQITDETGLTFRFTNAVRCACYKFGEDGRVSPREPAATEVKKCKPWLEEEIEICKPKVVVLAGGAALKAVLGSACKIGEMRGQPVWRGDLVYVPTYHPSNMSDASHKMAERQFSPEQYQEMITDDFVTAAKVAAGVQTRPDEINWRVVESEKEAMDLLRIIGAECDGMLTDDVESNSYPHTEVNTIFKPGLELTCFALSWKDYESVVIPLQALDCQPTNAKFQPSFAWQQEFMHALWRVVSRNQFLFNGQNFMSDLVAKHLKYGTQFWVPHHDLIYQHHLLWPHKRHSLGEMTRENTVFGGYEDELKAMVAKLPVKERGYHKVPFEVLARKCAYDAAITRVLTKKFWAMICADEQLRWVYDHISIPVTNALMQMSLRGIKIRREVAREVLAEHRIRQYKITRLLEEQPSWQACEKIVGEQLDMNKGVHRAFLMFDVRCEGLEPVELSRKTGDPSTDHDTLEELSEESDVAYGVMKLREMAAVETKLLRPLLQLPDKKGKVPDGWLGWDWRIHTTYKIYGTRTGRFSSSDPNLLNLPSHSNYMIEADEENDMCIIVADIMQAEMRVMGVVCDEPVLLMAYRNLVGPDGKPVDIHATIGSELFHVDYRVIQSNNPESDEDKRRTIKAYNFGVAYGKTAHGLSRDIRKPKEEAQRLLDEFFKILPNVKHKLVDEVRERLLKDFYVRSIFGRYWWVPEYQRDILRELQARKKAGKLMRKGVPIDIWDHPVAAKINRQAGNAIIQGPSTDLVSLGMIKFEREMQKRFITYTKVGNSYGCDLYLNNTIYDSVVVECKKDMAQEVGSLLKECLENPEPPFPFDIPWLVDLHAGKHMGKKELEVLEV